MSIGERSIYYGPVQPSRREVFIQYIKKLVDYILIVCYNNNVMNKTEVLYNGKT